MTIAAKHFDPLVGLDIHIILIPSPAGPIPTPLPNPYVGMVLDPMDYVPFFGATTFINGLPRGLAGTSGIALVPHLPLGGPFMKPPSNESEIFMGSATVVVDGEPQSFLGLPVLSCQDIGMPAPPRAKKKTIAKSLLLPTTVVLSIPMGTLVLIGGPPTISMMAMGMHAAMAALKKLKKLKAVARRIKAMSDRLHNLASKLFGKLGIGDALRNRFHRAICTVTGHPVDVATGKLFTDAVDCATPGPLPFRWERVWYSTSTHRGPLGHGWHHSYDLALHVEPELLLFRTSDGRHVPLPLLREGESYFDPGERLTLVRDRFGYAIRTIGGLWYRFMERGVQGQLSLVEISDRVGQRLKLDHEHGRLTRIWDSGGRAIDVTWNEQGQIRSLVGPHAKEPGARVTIVRYDYDRAGNLAAVTNALGHSMTYQYEQHLLVRETNKNGLSFHFRYDGQGPTARCVRTWGDGGIYDHKIRYEDGVSTVENSLGDSTTYFHDGALVTKTRDALGNERSTEYDDAGRVTAEIDELGNRTLSIYDERGNLTELTGPDGGKLSLEYGPLDQPVGATDPLGGKWVWKRDENGRLVEAVDAIGRVTRYEYHGVWLAAVTNPAGGRTAMTYDASGNIETVTGPDGSVTRYAHDALGRVVVVTDARGNREEREYDAVGHVTLVRNADGTTAALTYDAEGNVLSAVDASRDVKLAYQGLGRLASRSEGGATLRFEYDTEERLVTVYDAHGSSHRVERSPTGDIAVEIGFDGLRKSYTRNARGLVTRVDRPASRFTEYDHDAVGRVVGIRYFDGTSERFGYRQDGEAVLAANDRCTVELERDLVGRVVREKQGDHWVESEYDALGLRIRLRSSFGTDQTVERSATGLALRVSEKQSGYELRFVRDATGLELERSLPGGLQSRWQRDRLGRPTLHQVEQADGQSLRSVSYFWQPNARLARAVDAEFGPAVYEHDALGRLSAARYVGALDDLRVPDAVGNLFRTRQKHDRTYGPAGQLLEAHGARGVTRYAYDEEGNLIEKVEPGGRVWRYEWNAAGMLRRVLRPDGHAVEFAYDALGRRVEKSFRGQTTRWVWDANNPLHEWVEGERESLENAGPEPAQSTDAEIKKRDAELEQHLGRGPPERGSLASPITWLFEPESFAPIAKITADGPHSIVTDQDGTPALMLDPRGNPVFRARTGIWGDLRELEGDRFACPFRFPGQYEDAETGLYYNRFRYYDPEAGEYLSQDPIGLAGGLGLYAYVGDPTTQSDPFGLSCGPTQPKSTWNQFQQATRGTYASRADAAAGYRALKSGSNTSPWPDGFTPRARTMSPGETFNMALGPGQPVTRPGAFGTPDAIPNQQFVWDNLAVKQDWKPTGVDNVVTYRVKKPLPVQEGPVGPQFDQKLNRVLPGGADQVQMMVPPADRMDYLEVVGQDALPP